MLFGRRCDGMRSSTCVLLVEEDGDLLEWMTEVLGPRYDVTPCRSGRRALALLEPGREVDLLITAYRLPEMTGCQLHERVARIDLILALSTLLIVGGGLSPEDERYVEGARIRLLHQPFRPERLREEVRALAFGADRFPLPVR